MKLLFLAIFSGVCVFGGVLFFRFFAAGPVISASPPGMSTSGGAVSSASVGPGADRVVSTVCTDRQSADLDAFYQTIIDNNLFRPLNWEPPLRDSAYLLLGTIIASDGSRAKAYIQARESEQFYAVSVGQQVGEMTVQTIAEHRVTLLKRGQQVTLFLNRSLFLNPRPTRSDSARVPPLSVVSATDTAGTARERRKALEERVLKIRAERKRLRDFLQQYEKR